MIARSLRRDALLTLANSEGKQTSELFRSSTRRRGDHNRVGAQIRPTPAALFSCRASNGRATMTSGALFAPTIARPPSPLQFRSGAGFFSALRCRSIDEMKTA